MGFNQNLISKILEIINQRSTNSKEKNLTKIMFVASYYAYFELGYYIDIDFLGEHFGIKGKDINQSFTFFSQRNNYSNKIINPDIRKAINYYSSFYNLDEDIIDIFVDHDYLINKGREDLSTISLRVHIIGFIISYREDHNMNFSSDIMIKFENEKNINDVKQYYKSKLME